MSTPLLEIEDLCARVCDKEIIKGFNLTINEGEVHALMGPNGAGKSTLSNVLCGKEGYEVSASHFMKISVPFTMAAVFTGYILTWLIYM